MVTMLSEAVSAFGETGIFEPLPSEETMWSVSSENPMGKHARAVCFYFTRSRGSMRVDISQIKAHLHPFSDFPKDLFA